MTQQARFVEKSALKSGDEAHRKKLLKVISTYDTQVTSQKEDQWQDWSSARHVAAEIKEFTLQHLPELLEEFERKITAQGAKVLWARNVEEAQGHFLDIVARHNAKKVVKAKSMTTEEIHLNELLNERGIEVVESDLGELIVQLAGEKPYHIVTPAMHKSKAEISKLFAERLGCTETEDAEALTMVARAHLRNTYVTADIGVTGANFLIAESGAIVICENEGNARLTTSCPPVHVAFAGIEKVLPRLSDLELFLPLLATSGTGQQLTSYTSIIRGPRQSGESDGPEEMYVILIDNGRTALFDEPEIREALRCIRCGACLNACPVYRTVGGHTYETAYQGPIGSVITPYFRGLQAWHHLSYASSLCGACTEVCPVEIPLHHLLLKNRSIAVSRGVTGRFWSWALKGWALLNESRSRLEAFRPAVRLAGSLLRSVSTIRAGGRVPLLARKSFAKMWEEHEQ